MTFDQLREASIKVKDEMTLLLKELDIRSLSNNEVFQGLYYTKSVLSDWVKTAEDLESEAEASQESDADN